MSKEKEKFDEQRFDKNNRPATDLYRLKRDMFYILSKEYPDYTESTADKLWNEHVDKMKKYWDSKYAKHNAEREKQGKFEDEEYLKCFKETLLPIINNQPCNWENEVENPANTEMKFKAINAIGAGGYYKDKNRMRAEIAAKYLNTTLEFWQRLGKTHWRIYARYRLR
jgi:hypothetical protein